MLHHCANDAMSWPSWAYQSINQSINQYDFTAIDSDRFWKWLPVHKISDAEGNPDSCNRLPKTNYFIFTSWRFDYKWYEQGLSELKFEIKWNQKNCFRLCLIVEGESVKSVEGKLFHIIGISCYSRSDDVYLNWQTYIWWLFCLSSYSFPSRDRDILTDVKTKKMSQKIQDPIAPNDTWSSGSRFKWMSLSSAINAAINYASVRMRKRGDRPN